jgi:hypothetical protein
VRSEMKVKNQILNIKYKKDISKIKKIREKFKKSV